MKVLSVRPVPAWAIFHAGKMVENRSWTTTYRGPLLIHASNRRGMRDDVEWLERLTGLRLPDELEYSAIIGMVDLVGVVQLQQVDPTIARWVQRGAYHWILSSPRLCQPVDCLGKLRLWDFDGKISFLK